MRMPAAGEPWRKRLRPMRDFTQALMLGAARLSGAPASPHEVLTEAWGALPWVEAPEIALLDATTLLGAARAAGRPITTNIPSPTAAPIEPKPSARAAAVALLPRLLASEFRPLLGEWLERCALQKKVVPPFFLPGLFEVAAESERAAVSAVAGERGRWLARQNPNWSWVLDGAPSTDPTLWETGTPPERLACLRQWRATEPATGRERLHQTWETETPEFRLQALEIFAIGLSLNDEDFLTSLLSDRRKDTRQQAQALLASLPDSALANRFRNRANSWLTIKRSFLSKRLELELPSAFDPAWKADAVEAKPPAGIGEKAFWVQQVLACIPVRHWTQNFEIPAETLLRLAVDGEWSDLLLGSWFKSTLLDGDPQAAAALFPIVATNPKCLPAGTPLPQALALLLKICDEPTRWTLLEKQGGEHGLAWSWLREIKIQPSLAQSRVLLSLLAPALRDGFNPGGSPQAMLAARWIAPELRAHAEKLVQREAGLSKPAEAFLQALDLRASLHSAFLSTAN